MTRAEYEALIGRGVLDDAKVELLYGRIVTMSPQGNAHRYGIMQLTRLLVPAAGDRARVCIQLPFAASDDSEPEPDVAIVPPGDYIDEPPKVAWLIIELADASLAGDRRTKAKLYAASGVPEYWIVNLVDGTVEVHTEPGGDGYARTTTRRRGESMRVPRLDDVTVRVDDVLLPERAGQKT
jgi:Uma2 family endonuclease